ncbi:hypothetical protein FGM00_04095 [Aggregatimonas sangjinii]|uniref:Outer membrane protein beta-barrel domain-containing protein n=1 Tax=Aggregatimonas sangjinii TaxID=2583587 RepID=A0A5B7SMJ2_9FLAO|nr:hypothetical protein [Aggregatimonas sangjinii]QCW99331.1 hypothetical protein FGM00_04095 [Aggregatimonas sangjinii]
MNKWSAVFLTLLLSTTNMVFGQIEPDTKQSDTPSVILDARGYPISIWGEEHSSFDFNYRLSPKLVAQLQGFYDEYACGLCSDRFRTFVGLKWYVSNRFYLISGLDMEAEVGVTGRQSREPKKPRMGFTGGVGYDVRENLLLEAKGNFQLNNSKMGAFGEPQIRMPQLYTVGGKLKF